MNTLRCACGKDLLFRPEHAGQTGVCPACGKLLVIPASATVQAVPVPKAAPSASSHKVLEQGLFVLRPAGPESPPATGTAAVWALRLGLISFLLPVLASIAAILVAVRGLRETRLGTGEPRGRCFAVVGLSLGLLTLLGGPVLVCFLVLRAVRLEEARAVNEANLETLATAMLDFNASWRQLPPQAVYDEKGRPLYSWRILLLPHLGQGDLYREFHLDEPWDSPHNIRLVKRMPAVYAHPTNPRAFEEGVTNYQVFVGRPGEGGAPDCTVFVLGAGSRMGPCRFLKQYPRLRQPWWTMRAPASFMNGTASTILLAEAGEAVPWTKPEDMLYSPKAGLPALGLMRSDGFVAALADGQVRFVRLSKATDQAIRDAIDPVSERSRDW